MTTWTARPVTLLFACVLGGCSEVVPDPGSTRDAASVAPAGDASELQLSVASVVDAATADGASAAGDAAADDTRASASVTVTIDTTRRGPRIPDDYVGLSFTRQNISGAGGTRPIFSDPVVAPQLVSLLQQIGVRHIRLLSHDGSVPVPTAAQNDAFFQAMHDAGLGDGSVIYSFNIDNVDASYTADDDTARHLWSAPYRSMIEAFAIGNEPDFGIGGAAGYASYRDRWITIHDGIERAIGSPSPRAPFAGPDTGSEYPAPTNNPTDVNGVPFTLRFALDVGDRIAFASQHYYAAHTERPPAWAAGAYFVGDVVVDDADHSFTYRCTHDDPSSSRAPHNASANWEPYPRIWSSSRTYAQGDEVQDPGDRSQDFVCTAATCGPSAQAPHDATHDWTGDKPGLLSARQLAQGMLDPGWLGWYARLLNGALAGAPQWPNGLPFRLTESNAYGGGDDPQNQIFALALWAVDYFHWWAARGARGVDPFTLLDHYNSPLFEGRTASGARTGVVEAEPYAYGMLAFGQGSHGTTIDPGAVSLAPARDWLTVYPVVGAGHLYVTIVNKSHDHAGGTDASVTLRPMSFGARHARLIRLESTPGAAGSATASTATLGGATLEATGHWSGAWEDVPVSASGEVAPVTVRATTAVVLDITDD